MIARAKYVLAVAAAIAAAAVPAGASTLTDGQVSLNYLQEGALAQILAQSRQQTPLVIARRGTTVVVRLYGVDAWQTYTIAANGTVGGG